MNRCRSLETGDEFNLWSPISAFTIILFGSYARRQPRPESDVDLLVVMDTFLTETEQAVRILQAIEYHFGLDLLVRTPDNLAYRLELGDPFLREIITEGTVIYERVDG